MVKLHQPRSRAASMRPPSVGEILTQAQIPAWPCYPSLLPGQCLFSSSKARDVRFLSKPLEPTFSAFSGDHGRVGWATAPTVKLIS